MKNKTTIPNRSSCIALLVMFCLLLSPMTAWARKGDKNYKRGLEFEKLEQWEQAAQEFALAVAALPSDTEYQLHYRRAMFNASQKYMREGAALAEKSDYKGAYNAFRLAYGYDPVNQLSIAEMERMLRLQGEKDGIENGNATGNPSPKPTPTPPTSSRAEQLRLINYNGDLKAFVKQLGDELGINIIFDYQFQTRTFNINLRDVTTAQALDYIFATQNLFFQRLGPRTIIVADQSKRPQFQQLVARTFYIINVDAEDARTALQSAFPPTAGRSGQIFVNKKNNSLIIRDTPENILFIEQFLKTVDKDRAEVVMDVEIFEVNRSDLLQLGNQIGDAGSLMNLGGYGFGTPGTALSIGNGRRNIGNLIFPSAPATGATFIIPPTTLSLFQSRGRTRLLNRTQIHAFEGEATNINIGAKVPVQTASVVGFGTTNTPPPGTAQGAFSNGFPVIQYQDTGLTLKFTPTVFPNQDVQVKLEITSSVPQSVAGSLTPTFNQRTLNGTARIPNNRTLMIASVTQDTKSTSVQGLPILGLIPIFGRLFATPNDTSSQTDVVIIVTPRVLRAPNITPEDARTFPTGTVSYSTSDSIQSFISQIDQDDQAKGPNGRTARVNGNEDAKNVALMSDASKNIMLPSTSQIVASASPIISVGDEEPPAYIPAPKMLANAESDSARANQNNANVNAIEVVAKKDALKDATATNANLTTNTAEMSFVAPRRTMRVGEKQRVLLALATNSPLGMVAGVLHFDPKLFAVRAVNAGTIFGASKSADVNVAANTNTAANITQLNSAEGSVMLMMSPTAGALNGAGTLVEIEIEALAKGESEISFDRDSVRLIGANGQGVNLAQFATTKIKVE